MENKVSYIDHLGSDNLHALSAWVSTLEELNLEIPKNCPNQVDFIVDYILKNSKRVRTVEDLLYFLAKEEHESPFRMSSFIFSMKTDIATHIQKIKHSVILENENGESAKYKELKEDKFYLPKDWLNYGEVGERWYNDLKATAELTNDKYHRCLNELVEAGMSRKRAKETARFYKMYNSQICTYNKFSFAGVMLLAKKRSVEFAQDEIKEIALEMVELIRNIEGNPFKYSLKAFGY